MKNDSNYIVSSGYLGAVSIHRSCVLDGEAFCACSLILAIGLVVTLHYLGKHDWCGRIDNLEKR